MRLTEMKFYLYKSKSKIEMLHAQITNVARVKSSVEWKADIKFASLTKKSERETVEGGEGALQAVVSAIEAAGQVGTIEEPKDYIKGVLPMRWGLYDDCGSRPDEEPALVYFGGFDRSHGILLGLGGSSRHVVGHEGATSTYSRSSTAALVDARLEGLGNSEMEMPEWYKRETEQQIYGAIAIAQHYLRPPTQNLEFFAKVLSIGRVHGYEQFIGVADAKAILGTPLYLAMAPPYPEEESRWGLEEG